MKLNFEWSGIERLLEEIHTAKTAKTLYNEETGKGLWIVGDRGVYLMANTTDGIHYSKWKKGDSYFVVYADECNPHKMDVDEWCRNKRASFGGDDGTCFIDITEIEDMVAKNAASEGKPSHLCIDFGKEEPTIAVVWKIQRGKKK